MTAPTRVLLADDDPRYRATIRTLLDADPGVRVVAEAATGREARTRAAEHRPDVVLMDVRMPDEDGISATAHLTALPTPPKVLILTTFDLDEAVRNALHAGASGFLLKDAPPTQLLQAVHTIATGEALLSPTATRRLITDFRHTHRPPRPLPTLTTREREVLTLITKGLSNAEIADTLQVSRHTVKTHITHLLTKLPARDRVHLVIAGYEAGLAGSPAPER
ncbi:response regulator transcription factor [Actinosynnema sp. NPDC020468]|uniref:response regulator transcription factor n=1 Tax=Actinosynnema sp. NPDC020468 TaxID=3154488 RepID=UPI0033E1E6D5